MRQTFRVYAFLTLPLLSPALSLRAAAQGVEQHTKTPQVIVQLGHPNVWTMDQAHYLLERNRALDLQITQKQLDQLDPNAPNGVRVSQTTTSFGAAVNYDQMLGLSQGSYRADRARYDALLQEQSDDARALREAMAKQEEAQSKVDSEKDPSQLPDLQAKLASAKINTELKQTRYNTVTSAIPASAPAAPAAAASSGSAISLPSTDPAVAFYQGLASAKADNDKLTKLAASQQLENHINLQYEMVAKQLTLLRDQAGPDNMVLFLELPQSIYLTNKFRPYPYLGGLWGAHVAQSWWRMDAALVAESVDASAQAPSLRQLQLLAGGPGFFSNDSASEQCGSTYVSLIMFFHPGSSCARRFDATYNASKMAIRPEPGSAEYFAQKKALLNAEIKVADAEQYRIHAGIFNFDAASQLAAARKERDDLLAKLDELGAWSSTNPEVDRPRSSGTAARSTFLMQTDDNASARFVALHPYGFSKKEIESFGDKQGPHVCGLTTPHLKELCGYIQNWTYSIALSAPEGERPNTADAKNLAGPDVQQLSSPAQPLPMYSLDLIPRQSALNVADSNTTSSNLSFAALFKFISGLGVESKYQRQRNQFSQFVQQETYASAFGKGSYEFGWTFGPLPGTNRLAPGLRTTYAVVVVPKATRVLRLYGVGCGYRRRDVPHNPFYQLEWRDKDFHPRSIAGEECSELNTFDVEVPNSNDNLSSDTTAEYATVPAGGRAVIELSGRFDPQVGVLVNGTPLTKVPSISNPSMVANLFNTPDPAAGESGVKGVFEVVSSKQLLVTFVLPTGTASKPDLRLVTAGKTTQVKLNDPVFSAQLSLTSIFKDPKTEAKGPVKLTLVGSGFQQGTKLTVSAGAMKPMEYTPYGATSGFDVKSDNVAIVTLDREDSFTASALILSRESGKGDTVIASKDFSDTFPPLVKDCKLKLGEDGAVTVTIPADYVTAGYTPKLDGLIDPQITRNAGGWVVTGRMGTWDKKLEIDKAGQMPTCRVVK